jgi:hypothetical protein
MKFLTFASFFDHLKFMICLVYLIVCDTLVGSYPRDLVTSLCCGAFMEREKVENGEVEF